MLLALFLTFWLYEDMSKNCVQLQCFKIGNDNR